MSTKYPTIGQLKTVAAFRARLAELGLSLPVDETILTAAAGSPLAAPCEVAGVRVGNRWCIQPMEGWDANRDGSPSAHTLRRWRNFGLSGPNSSGEARPRPCSRTGERIPTKRWPRAKTVPAWLPY